MRIEILNKGLEEKYTQFILGFEKTLLYASVQYRDLLKAYLNCEDEYLIAIADNDEIKGVLPLFKKYNEDYGFVYNSLPFYGSNGSIIAGDGDMQIKQLLIDKYLELLNAGSCAAGTIITSPFETDHAFYEKTISPTFKDSRIGQVTFLPDDVDKVMDVYHSKTRNNIRKGVKSNVQVTWEDGLSYTDFLFETHKDNMQKVGGLFKPKMFFETVINTLTYGVDYKIYIAKVNEVPVSALLAFYFNKTAEYFTPVTVEKYREYQPTSVILYHAMMDAVANHFKWWNWGGTWLNQGGVYDFKKKWGTTDLPYYYYTTIINDNITKLNKELLLDAYPSFFVLPFNQLADENV